MGEHNHPEVSMHTTPLAAYMNCIYEDDWEGVGKLMADSATRLAAIGADFAICPDNTIHAAYATAIEHSPIPWLHIADCVAEEAVRNGYRKLGVTGTAYLVTSDVYPDALKKRDIEFCIADEAKRNEMSRIIFDELVKGQFTPESQKYFDDVFKEFREQGCDAVVMGCTEIPLLMDGYDTSLPTLDSTRLLARAAIGYAAD